MKAAAPRVGRPAEQDASRLAYEPAQRNVDVRDPPCSVQERDSTQPPEASSIGRGLPWEASEYLEGVRPGARRDLWQLFVDRHGADRRSEQILIPRGRAGDYLSTRNEQGFGVFVALSDFEVARRLIENVVRVHHIWVDLDGGPLPSSWPLRPHVVVNTSPGKFQAIWRVDGVPQDRETHNRTIVALAKTYGADEGAQGLNRVLRVPGFKHQKRDPVLVRLVSVGDHRAWNMDEVLTAWPGIAAALATPKRRRHRAVHVTTLSDADAQAALERQAARVATVPPPELRATGSPGRNTVLTSAAFAAGLLVGRGVVDEASAVEAMTNAALYSGLPPGEVKGTVERQVTAGMRKARS